MVRGLFTSSVWVRKTMNAGSAYAMDRPRTFLPTPSCSLDQPFSLLTLPGMASFFSSILTWFQGLFWSKHAEISVVGLQVNVQYVVTGIRNTGTLILPLGYLQASGKTSFVNILGNGEWSEEVVPTVAFNLRKGESSRFGMLFGRPANACIAHLS